MANLKVSKREINNIFTLHRDGERAATYAIGFALANSPSFLAQFMKSLEGDTKIRNKNVDHITIELEKHRKEQNPGKGNKRQTGRTDIEIGIENNFRIIVEAKKGWGVAGDSQLERYAKSIDEKDGDAYLMTISQATKGAHSTIKGHPVIHRSWQDIQNIVSLSIKNQGSDERENLLLRDLYVHLAHYVFQKRGSVCIVPLSGGRPANDKYSFREIVTKGGGYFHPIARYPEEQIPEYLGFRWDSELHLLLKFKEPTATGYEFESTGKGFPIKGGTPEPLPEKTHMWRDKDKKDHRIYKLEGENLLPEGKSIPSGDLDHRTSLHRCDYDILQSGGHKTLKEIVRATDRAREERAKEALRKFLSGK